jgi:outer membrane protein assembly factor BamB
MRRPALLVRETNPPGTPIMTCRLVSTLTATVLLCLAPARAEDWPEFRGPTGQGIASGSLPVRWSSQENVAWKQAIPGKGWSSPVVVGGRVYLTSSLPVGEGPEKDLSLLALCLDAGTGKVLWQTEVFRADHASAPPIHGKNSHASPTPIVHGQRLFVHFGHLGTACLDLSGQVLWRNDSIKYQPVHGSGGSPILVGDLLVFSCDGGDRRLVVALEQQTGKVRWQTERSGQAERAFSFSTPLLITVKGQEQIISPGSDMVGAYDPASGREIWRVTYEGYSLIPRPVFGHGLVYVCTGFNNPRLLAIRPDGQGDVTGTHVVWMAIRSVPLTPSPLLVGDELYMVSDQGVASCLDARTGKIQWQERLTGAHSASPLYADGKIYFQSEDGAGTVVRAGRQFERLARNKFDERTLASYAAADGALFIRTEKNLYRIGK